VKIFYSAGSAIERMKGRRMRTLKNKERFAQLIDSLQQGWQIEEPVLLGTSWGNNGGSKEGMYHFILRNRVEDKTTMISLPPSPKLLVFLHENNLNINSL
jgi:hypothetical protein